MLFNSYAFLFVFLPIALIGFHVIHLASRRTALNWITLCSLVFYAYWDYRYIGLIVPSVLFNWGMGHLIGRRTEKKWLLLGITTNLMLIGWFKYSLFVFLAVTAHTVEPPSVIRHIVLPLGISFFTFQQIAYLVNVYRRHERAASLETHAFIVMFFPHLIAGPIVLYENIVAQVRRHPKLTAYFWRSARVGLLLLAIGLFKKVVIADSLAPFVNSIFTFATRRDYELLLVDAFTGATTYSLQLYFDFSGYSDMAIGLAMLFGFRLPINFNSPYKASSIVDFWRRWHITLSSFFRNYLYIPLGGNRRGPVLQVIYLMTVFLMTGLWHGAGWIFISWGALHGSLVCIAHVWSTSRYARALRSADAAWMRHAYGLTSWAATLLSVIALWVVFRADSWRTVLEFWRALSRFQLQGSHPIPDPHVYYALAGAIPLLFLACWLLPNSLQLAGWVRQQLRRADASPAATSGTLPRARAYLPAVLTGLCLYIAVTSIGSEKSEFLYFNF